jgi:enterochelin esterase family protein
VRGLGTAGGDNSQLPDAATLNARLKLFWIGCGTEDFVFARSQALHESLDAQQIRHEFFPHPGTHEWQAWRRHLYLFAQKLFVH